MSLPASAASFFVCILECADGSFYVGQTSDVAERVVTHNDGRGAPWTARRRPVVLVYKEAFATQLEAVCRERQIKGWSRAKKSALIVGDTASLKALAARRADRHL